ncbi:hypothetical protein [Bradyrhizobium sp. 613_E4_N2_2]|uniref:hypothetical protein n=1 Tax=Bradyrhizobium sp. 613_E4_N2_2 TaxID=3240371 RepID=UPI003F8A7A46
MNRRATTSERKSVEKGGRRLPGGIISKQAAEHLDMLRVCNYAPSIVKVIERALREAVENQGW